MTTGTLTIRMGASHWDATVHRADGDDYHYDFRQMTYAERGEWHRQLMAGAHRIYGDNDQRRAGPLPKGKRRGGVRR